MIRGDTRSVAPPGALYVIQGREFSTHGLSRSRHPSEWVPVSHTATVSMVLLGPEPEDPVYEGLD